MAFAGIESCVWFLLVETSIHGPEEGNEQSLLTGAYNSSSRDEFDDHMSTSTDHSHPRPFFSNNTKRWWAEQRRVDCRVQHSFPENGFELGENIFWGGGSGWTPSDAIRAWAEEEKYYRYESGTCEEGGMCAHFTQIVWKTWRVGCARVVCDDGDVFMTCNYDPPGNYIGQKPY